MVRITGSYFLLYAYQHTQHLLSSKLLTRARNEYMDYWLAKFSFNHAKIYSKQQLLS